MEDLSKSNYGTTAGSITKENGTCYSNGKGNSVSEKEYFKQIKEMELIERNYYSHGLKEQPTIDISKLKEGFPNLARKIMNYCPDSRERSLALTKLEECMFWANASIERN